MLRASAGLVPAGARRRPAARRGIEGWVGGGGEATRRGEPGALHPDGLVRARAQGALLAVPMRLRGNVVGVLAATRAAPGRFAESDLWWLSIFAELGAVALENDTLLLRERRRTHEAEVLAELASLPTEPLGEFARHAADAVRRPAAGRPRGSAGRRRAGCAVPARRRAGRTAPRRAKCAPARVGDASGPPREGLAPGASSSEPPALPAGEAAAAARGAAPGARPVR